MLLCIMGTSEAMAGKVTAKWDFTGTTPTPSTLASVNVESRATFYPSDNDVAALYVDALNGKLQYRNSGDAQFNANTKLRVPVYSTADVVTVTSYPGYHYFTVGGTAATQDETVHNVTASEASQGYVEIVATSNAYLYSITLETTGTTAKHAAWNFYNEIPSTIHGTLIENTNGTVTSSVSSISLDVYASNSKFQARGSDAWFTAGTTLKVPVAHEGDIVTVMAYNTSYDNYTVGGVDASGSATPIFTYTATSTDASNRYVSIEATNQSYIYAIAVQQLPDEVVPETINYAIDFTKSWAAALNTSGSASQCWVTSINEGVPTYESSAPAEYLMYFKGYYKNSTYGIYYGAQFQIPVPAGSYKITLGCSDYGDNVPVTDGTKTLTTISNSGGKYASDPNNISYGYVTVNEACTLYLDAPNNNTYFPYFAIETVNDVPEQYTITFMNGESEVSSSAVYEGTSIGTLPNAPSVGATQQFIGWYTALDGTGTFATEATIPTADITYYANILDITTTNGYVVVDNSGTDGKNGESFKAAIAWADANNGYNVFVPNGTYYLGSQINSSISGAIISRQMAIIGESMEGVIIKGETEGDNESINSATLKINNNITGVYLQNLTIQNYPLAYNTTNKAERAVALWDRATETVLKNVYLRGTQDVYYTNY